MKAKKYQSLTGMPDILPAEVKLWQQMEKTAHEVFGSYLFSEIRTPVLEDLQLFARGIGEGTQVVQKEMYSFEDKGGDQVTLRPEGTASAIRAYLQNSLSAQDAITKIYYMGPMFRYERPQKGRQRQFHQIGVELIGTDSPLADAEVVIMLDRFVKELGIKDYKLEINSLGTISERKDYLAKLNEYFTTYKDKFCDDCLVRLEKNPLRIFDCKVRSCGQVCKEAPVILDHLKEETAVEFEIFKSELERAGVAYEVNPFIVRGLDYYEKTAFEMTSDQLGSQSAFVGGGRYNSLVKELGGNDTPAVGFAIGCERLILLMQANEKGDEEKKGIYFTPIDEESFQKCRQLMQEMRDEGIVAEMDYVLKSLKSQMRRANKLGFRYVGIMGNDELQKSSIVLKDLEKSTQNEIQTDTLKSALK